ncbi:MAG: type II CRISPR-associated endonuclease Cas1 [Flammeovirgaceae bacterium]|nr:type II CRISPR-associated endonuclease Cas1 [Flammeovirgaceae bacterium]
MIKRTLCFTQPVYLSTTKNQLVIKYAENEQVKKVPIEDIGVLVLEHAQITVTHTLISLLLGNNVAVITCDSHHLPQGMLLNLNGHSEQHQHFSFQLEARQLIKDRFWQQTIKAKISNQSALLKMNGIEAANMVYWSKKVDQGDSKNLEARAAAYYWQKLFVDHLQSFRRGRFGEPPNNLLNYGYAILRAIIARSLVASGLLPILGYHHHNKYNAYCLADDVIEPYRPYVDQLVLELVRSEDNYEILTPALKKQLLMIPVLDVHINQQLRPLMLAVHQTTSSLYKCYANIEKNILFPVM